MACRGPGGLAVATQSGGVGFTLLDIARTHGVGVHAFVSLGAKLDVSSNDLLAAWMDDDEVAVAALHLESFGNALKFARTARRFAERKPLLAVVGGRRSTASAVGVDALFAQSGVIACRSATEMAEAAALLVQQPLPDGYRVGVVTNAGGMGVLVADVADAEGLAVPRLSATLQATLGEVASGSVGSSNPVDLGADLSPERPRGVPADPGWVGRGRRPRGPAGADDPRRSGGVAGRRGPGRDGSCEAGRAGRLRRRR